MYKEHNMVRRESLGCLWVLRFSDPPCAPSFITFILKQPLIHLDLDYLSNWFRVNELFFLTWRKENLKICLVPVNGWICQVKLSVSGSLINTITCYKYFGVHLDPSHNFETRFLKKYPKAAGRVNLWRRIRSSIDNLNAQRINQSMIMPLFTY